ncbi:unnamed protein product [Bathycoccus prasinos]
MPTVNLKRDDLFQKLGKTFTEEEFDELCFDFGIELDEVTTEREMSSKFLGVKDTKEGGDGGGKEEEENDAVIYKIDIPANRYDLLCLEGIARALNIFRGQRSTPVFRTVEPENGQERLRVKVNKTVSLVRPFIVCAVLRNVTFTKESRIGTHDLAKIEGPFTYDAKPKEEIEFVPLKQTKSFRADELLEHYKKNDQKLKAYVPLIESSAVAPVLKDKNGTVLSLPPLINGSVSAISLETKDVFIECTATDLHKAKIVLNTVVTMFSEHCAKPFQVEPVDVVDFMGNERSYPDFMTRFVDVDVDYVNKRIGTEIETKEMAALLCKMQLASKVTAEKTLRVEIPPTRSDVLHACDIAEDVAIAYGYNNIKQTIPKASTIGKGQPINHFSDLVREEIARMGFSEVLTWILCSHDDNFKNVRREDNGNCAAIVANPSSIDVQVARSSLLPGVLKALGANKDAPLPVKLFEVGDVVVIDENADVGARNSRRLLALHSAQTSGLESIHGVLDRVMQVTGAAGSFEPGPGNAGYELIQTRNEPTFFPGRQATIVRDGKEIGVFGIVHPDVLKEFDIVNPVSVLELELEPLLERTQEAIAKGGH